MVNLRLDNNRQDLRRHYFGHGIEHHSFQSLLMAASNQVSSALKALSYNFDPTTYVCRDAETVCDQFIQSEHSGLLIVDHAGRGKTSMLCAVAKRLVSEGKPALLLEADSVADASNALERESASALGYTNGYLDPDAAFRDAVVALRAEGKVCTILLDGVSQATDPLRRIEALYSFLCEQMSHTFSKKSSHCATQRCPWSSTGSRWSSISCSPHY